MLYKPEVDGLRAIAVLLVLFTHLSLASMAGGFIGVDVFFVISGFLITSSILSSVKESKFNIWQFYGRRLVRLYPALIVVIFIVIIFGCLIASPEYLKLIARSGKYAIASMSNIYFNAHSGYFDAATQSQVFLHTWSLGVEWQFYLIWPFIILGTLKISQRFLIITLILITVISLIASQWATLQQPTAAYYLVQYRAFELSIGSLLVFIYAKKPSALVGTTFTLAGIATLLVTAYIYTSQTPFPGIAALIPCLASAACIYGGQSFLKGNPLRVPAVVYLGKISYSVYLWHWPIIVLYGYYVFRDLYLGERLIILVLSLGIGALSYEFIEKRFQWRKFRNKRNCCLIIIFIAAGIAGLCQYIGRNAQGMPWRLGDNPLLATEYNTWGGEGWGHALRIIGSQNEKPFAVFAGDSIMGNMATGLQESIPEKKSLYLAYTLGCIISEIDLRQQVTPLCRDLSTQAINTANQQQLPLVLSQAWQGYQNLTEANAGSNSGEERAFILTNLDDIRNRTSASNIPIIIISDPPYRSVKGAISECYLRPNILPRLCDIEAGDFRIEEAFNYKANQILESYAQTHDGVYYIDVAPVFCPNGNCIALEHAKMYSDHIHLSVYGSKVLAPYILREVQQAIEQHNTKETID